MSDSAENEGWGVRLRLRLRENSGLLRFVLLVGIPAALFALLLGRLQAIPEVQAVIHWMHASAREWWAIPLFVALYIVFAIFVLPVGLLAAIAAVAWGWKAGGSIELVTCTIAALGPYTLARRGSGEALLEG